jgi:hypothetical protein
MAKFARVMLKGEPVQWFDYPLPQNLALFVLGCRMQGGIMPDGLAQIYVAWDEIRFIMQIETESPQIAFMQPAGQA